MEVIAVCSSQADACLGQTKSLPPFERIRRRSSFIITSRSSGDRLPISSCSILACVTIALSMSCLPRSVRVTTTLRRSFNPTERRIKPSFSRRLDAVSSPRIRASAQSLHQTCLNVSSKLTAQIRCGLQSDTSSLDHRISKPCAIRDDGDES